MTAPDRPAARRSALLVTTSTYEDDALAGLVSPAQDAVALAEVLGDAELGGFTVTTVADGTAAQICRAVEDFAAERDRADLLLLYLSCHGLKDDLGRLYFASRDTRRDRLRSTSVSAGFVNDVLFGCPSRRKVLLLDCCYSGAFAKGLAVKADPAVHTRDHFDARGLVVLTASDATQYAFEGDRVDGRAEPSRFTACLVDGLRSGVADLDGDGLVSVDDAFEFTRRRLAELPGRASRGAQSPRKWQFDVAGSIVLARSPAGPSVPTPTALPAAPGTSPAGGNRAQQWSWWAAVALFMVTAVASSALAALLVDWVVDPFVIDEYAPAQVRSVLASALAGAAWAVVYALGDVSRPGRARWFDLHRRWSGAWRDLFGTGHRVRALVLAVPLNVALTLLPAMGMAAAGYWLSGSDLRDRAFTLTFLLATSVAAVAVLTRPGPDAGGRSRDA